MITKDTILFFDKENFIFNKRRSNYLIVSEKYKKWMKVSETSLYLLNLMDGNRSIEVIAKEAAQKYKLSQKKIEDDCIKFCEELARIKFLETDIKENNILEQVYIDITNRCKQKCKYCNKRDISSLKTDLNISQVESMLKMVDDRIDPEKTIIHITGGEPLLNSNLEEILKNLGGKGFKICLWTCGEMLDRERAIMLGKYVTNLYVSVDSPDENINDSLRGKGAYEIAVNAMHILAELSIPYYIASTPTVENYDTFEMIVDFAIQNNARGLYINRPIMVSTKGEMIENSFPNLKNEYDQLESRTLKKSSVYSSWKNNSIKKNDVFNVYPSRFDCLDSINRITEKRNCGCGEYTVLFDVEGNIYPCKMLQIKKFRGIQETEVQKEPETNGPAFEDCQTCIYAIFCKGGCKAANYYEGCEGEKSIQCNYTKALFDKIFWG